MKKLLSLISVMLLFASCTNSKSNLAPENQLKLISDSKNIWVTDFGSGEPVCYTVCDLNNNGRLEIIAASIQGTGFYTSYKIYEVSENGKSLVEYKNAASEGDSLADLSWSDTIFIYKDPDTGIYHSAVTDYLKNGAAYYYEEKRDLILSDYTVTEIPIAYKTTIYHDSEGAPVVTSAKYTSGGEQKISENEFDSAFDVYFEGYEKKELKLKWLSSSDYDFSALKSDEIYALFKG